MRTLFRFPDQARKAVAGLKGCFAGPPVAVFATGLVLILVSPAVGQGMSPDSRKNIHALFNGHAQIQRELNLTAEGYEAITESTNGLIAVALQQHVQQMQDRLESGLAVRRWDPAFAEYRTYFDQIQFKVEKTENGVKVVATGETPAAVKVAQNHAKVITEFVNQGWAAHDASHPAALTAQPTELVAGTACVGKGRGHCGAGGCQGSCGRGNNMRAAHSSTNQPKIEQ